MAHFAKILDGKVIQVIVAEPQFFQPNMVEVPNRVRDENGNMITVMKLIQVQFTDNSPGEWIQTSYNGNIRKNFAGIGFTYDRERDAFIPPQPFPSWILNEETCLWVCPAPYPLDEKSYVWSEDQLQWINRT